MQEASPDPYKAIVVLQLSGGLDSFNVLMPHTSCSTYKYYRNAREVLAYDDMLDIDNNDPEVYDCNKLGVNKHIPILKEVSIFLLMISSFAISVLIIVSSFPHNKIYDDGNG